MSGKTAKRLRHTIRKEASAIKTQGLKEFIEYYQTLSIGKRFMFGLKVLFKRFK